MKTKSCRECPEFSVEIVEVGNGYKHSIYCTKFAKPLTPDVLRNRPAWCLPGAPLPEIE